MSKRPRSQSRQMAGDPAAANKRDPQEGKEESHLAESLAGARTAAPKTDGPEFVRPRQKVHHEDEKVTKSDDDE